MTLDSIPQARVVRHAGQLVAPPPLPRPPPSADPGWLHTALVYAVGLWPLTGVLLLVAGLLVVTANLGAP